MRDTTRVHATEHTIPRLRGDVACTVVSRRRLPEARVLAHSFQSLHPHVPFVVLVADSLNGTSSEPFAVLGPDDVELPAHLKFQLGEQELSYAATPMLMRTLLDAGARRVLFFKQETIVYSSARRLFDTLHSSSVLLAPHITSPIAHGDPVERERGIILSGAFNVGVIGVSNHAEGRAFLDWWAERTTWDCTHDVAHGQHFEQRWLTLVPGCFGSVAVDRDDTTNVGHWQLPDVRVRIVDDVPHVGDRPVVALRFSGFDADRPHRPTTYETRLEGVDIGDASRVFEDYVERLVTEGHHERAEGYAFGRFDDGTAIPGLARRMYAALSPDDRQRFGDPFTTGAESFRAWLDSTDGAGRPTRFWLGVHAARADLQEAFQDPAGEDRAAFLDWIEVSGHAEHDAHGFRSGA